MTTFTAWKFTTAEGAQSASDALKGAADDGLITIIDRAIVSWPEGAAKPEMRHTHEDTWRGTGWGAFWGMLFGMIFFVPLLGVAAGAAIGALSKVSQAVGLTDAQIDQIRAEVVPGTSLLCVVTEDGNLDRVGERFHGIHFTLVATNLTPAERSLLMETFG